MKGNDHRPDRSVVGLKLAALKERLLWKHLSEVRDVRVSRLLRLAASEAEALAWQTSEPLLFMPELLNEKLEAVRRYAAAQESLLRRNGPAPPPKAEREHVREDALAEAA